MEVTDFPFRRMQRVDFAKVVIESCPEERPVMEPRRFLNLINNVLVPFEGKAIKVQASVRNLLSVGVELPRVRAEDEETLGKVSSKLASVKAVEFVGSLNVGSL